MNPTIQATAEFEPRTDVPLLRFENVVKQFGGTRAVDDVTFDLYSHEVLALLGGTVCSIRRTATEINIR